MAEIIPPAPTGVKEDERKTLLIFVILILSLILLPPIIIPILIYRVIIRLLSEKYKPDLGRMLSPCSSLMAADDLYNKPTCALIPTYYIDGVLEEKPILKRMEAIVAKENYAELTQTLTTWMGFYFWKWDNNFSLKNHITFIDEPISSEAEIFNIITSLGRKPFRKDRPLWEMVVYTNYITSEESSGLSKRQTVYFCRFHHCLADGFALLHLLDEITQADFFSTVSKPDTRKKSSLEKILFVLKLIIAGPYQVTKSILESMEFSPWRVPVKEAQGEYVTDAIELPFSEITQTSKSLGVSTTAVIFSAYFGGVRRFMLEMGVEIPKKFTTAFPLPLPGIAHPGSLTNHLTMVPVLAQLHEPSPLKRLLESHALFENLKESTLPYCFYIIMSIVGSLMVGICPKLSIASCQLTNFPGPQTIPTFAGLPLTKFQLGGKIPMLSSATVFTSHMFGGKLSLRYAFDTCIYDDEEMAKKMMEFIKNELDFYKKCAEVMSFEVNKNHRD